MSQDIDSPPFCRGTRASDGHERIDSAGVEVVTNVRPEHDSGGVYVADAPVLSIGAGERGEAYEFGRITAATRLSDGRIVVADGQSSDIRVFDAAGMFLGRYGGEGDGPGEYRAIHAMRRGPGDTLWIADIRNRRVTKLDAGMSVVWTGVLPTIRWSVIDPQSGRETSGSSSLRLEGVLSDGSLIVSNSLRRLRTEEVTNVSRDSLILRRVSADFATVDSLGLILGLQLFEFFPGDRSVTFGEALLGHVKSLAIANDRLYYGAGEEFEIQERGPDGRTQRLIRICEPAERVQPERLEHVIEDRLAEFSDEALRYEEPALRGIPHPSHAPAYLAFQVDDRNRLWVRDFTYPGESQRWKVIDSDGRWLADVTMPADIDVLDVGAGYVLARHITELDVHVLRVYEMQWDWT